MMKLTQMFPIEIIFGLGPGCQPTSVPISSWFHPSSSWFHPGFQTGGSDHYEIWPFGPTSDQQQYLCLSKHINFDAIQFYFN